MMHVSERFLVRLKLHSLPAYRIAQQAGVSPSQLSKLINGIDPVKPQDPRIVAVGKVLGLEATQCFRAKEN